MGRERGDPVWHETVAAGSPTRAATVRIPRAGTFTFWYATTRQHGRCSALGLPAGGWAGGPGGEHVGGSLPGCYPTPAQINADQVEHGGGPVSAITGIDDNASDVTVDGAPRRIYFGVVDGRGRRCEWSTPRPADPRRSRTATCYGAPTGGGAM